MSATDERPTEPANFTHSKPQAPQPREGEMPPMTEFMCPHCYGIGVVREKKHEHRIGTSRVYECRVGHLWSPKAHGGPKAVEALLAAREKRRKARMGLNPKTGKPVKQAPAQRVVDETKADPAAIAQG